MHNSWNTALRCRHGVSTNSVYCRGRRHSHRAHWFANVILLSHRSKQSNTAQLRWQEFVFFWCDFMWFCVISVRTWCKMVLMVFCGTIWSTLTDNPTSHWPSISGTALTSRQHAYMPNAVHWFYTDFITCWFMMFMIVYVILWPMSFTFIYNIYIYFKMAIF